MKVWRGTNVVIFFILKYQNNSDYICKKRFEIFFFLYKKLKQNVCLKVFPQYLQTRFLSITNEKCIITPSPLCEVGIFASTFSQLAYNSLPSNLRYKPLYMTAVAVGVWAALSWKRWQRLWTLGTEWLAPRTTETLGMEPILWHKKLNISISNNTIARR